MADTFRDIGQTITAPVGNLWQGLYKGLAPGVFKQADLQRKQQELLADLQKIQAAGGSNTTAGREMLAELTGKYSPDMFAPKETPETPLEGARRGLVEKQTELMGKPDQVTVFDFLDEIQDIDQRISEGRLDKQSGKNMKDLLLSRFGEQAGVPLVTDFGRAPKVKREAPTTVRGGEYAWSPDTGAFERTTVPEEPESGSIAWRMKYYGETEQEARQAIDISAGRKARPERPKTPEEIKEDKLRLENLQITQDTALERLKQLKDPTTDLYRKADRYFRLAQAEGNLSLTDFINRADHLDNAERYQGRAMKYLNSAEAQEGKQTEAEAKGQATKNNAPSTGKKFLKTAINPTTGERMGFDGRKWIPIR